MLFHINYGPGKDGFELIENRGGGNSVFTVFLHGPASESFQQKIQEWRANKPEQSEVEKTIEQYFQLGQTRVGYH